MIERCRDAFPVRLMCRCLKVSSSGYFTLSMSYQVERLTPEGPITMTEIFYCLLEPCDERNLGVRLTKGGERTKQVLESEPTGTIEVSAQAVQRSNVVKNIDRVDEPHAF